MRNFISASLAAIASIAMLASSGDALAQARRSGPGGGGQSSSSSQTHRSSGSSSQRSGGQSMRQSSPQTRSNSNMNRGGQSSVRRSAPESRPSTNVNSRGSLGPVNSGSMGSQSRSMGPGNQSRSPQSRPSGSSSMGGQNRQMNSPSGNMNRGGQSGSMNRGGQQGNMNPGGQPSTQNRNQNMARQRPGSNMGGQPGGVNRGGQPGGMNRGNQPFRGDNFRINDHNVSRIPPRDREMMDFGRVNRFYGRDPHFFGRPISFLPPRHRVIHFHGLDYYFYNDVFYRLYGGRYYVCRPPFGYVLDRAIRDLTLSAVTFAYYPSIYRYYDAIDDNYRYIDEQNRIIAQNNAIIASQSGAIAVNNNLAEDSYTLASRLGLIQSYANANEPYYYDDGVFYVVNPEGGYKVIVPPAGALVEKLPEDYDTIQLGGAYYYRVDNTVYRPVLFNGNPYLEVLGQLNTAASTKYGIY